MNADLEMRSLSEKLGLVVEPQDWGISNADPSRIDEFLRICETTDLTPTQQYAMSELILASLNDAMVAGLPTHQVVDALERIQATQFHGLLQQIRYWSSLHDEAEFPISALLHRMTTHA